jgi:hypothetical protein
MLTGSFVDLTLEVPEFHATLMLDLLPATHQTIEI